MHIHNEYFGERNRSRGSAGTASFGIVEALKWTPPGAAGFGQIGSCLGRELNGSLRIAHGQEVERLLRAQYRQDLQTQATIAKSLRQGVRIGLNSDNAENVALFLGTVDTQALKQAATKVLQCTEVSDTDRAAIGRFELAADARIESALSRGQDVYLGSVRCAASLCVVASPN